MDIKPRLTYLTTLKEEVTAHALENDLNLTGITDRLSVFQGAVEGALSTISNDLGVISVTQGQIKAILEAIDQYMPHRKTSVKPLALATVRNAAAT